MMTSFQLKKMRHQTWGGSPEEITQDLLDDQILDMAAEDHYATRPKNNNLKDKK